MKRTTKFQFGWKLYIRSASIMLLILATIVSFAYAQPVKGSQRISPYLFGLFFEDINYGADGKS